MKSWKTLKTRLVLKNRWHKVRCDKVLLPNGKTLDEYYVWENGDVSAVVPETTDGKYVLVKQYRYGADEVTLEFPVGFVEKDEKPLQAAKREMQEETGYVASKLKLVGKLNNNASKETGNIYVYLAKNVQKQKLIHNDDFEHTEVVLLTKSQLKKYILAGKIRVSFSVAAALLSLWNN